MKRLVLLLLSFPALYVYPQTISWAPPLGPFGGNIQCLAQSPNGTLYAGTDKNGIFRSTDGGVSWVQSVTGLNTVDVRTITVKPNGTILAGSYTWYNGGAVYRSVDNGQHWSPSNLTSANCYSILVQTDGSLIAGTGVDAPAGTSGVYRSTDDGSTWSLLGLSGQAVRTIASDSSGRLFAGTNAGVYCSTDSGLTWSPRNTGLTNLTIYSLRSVAGGRLFAGSYGGGLFVSTDAGSTWSIVGGGFSDPWVRAILAYGARDLLVGTDGSLVHSSDNGASWQVKSAGLTYPNGLFRAGIQAIVAMSDGGLIVGTGGPGVYKSTDQGDSWRASNGGLSSCSVGPLLINGNAAIFAESGAGLQRSTDGGGHWTEVMQGFQINRQVLGLAKSPSGTIFAGKYGEYVYRSTDNGDHWVRVNNGLTSDAVTALVAKTNNLVFAATRQGGMFRSTDGGDHWATINSGLTIMNITCLAMDSSGRIYAGAWGDANARGDVLFRSTNDGDTWTPQMTGISSAAIFSLCVAPDGRLLATGGWPATVFNSTDGGDHWTASSAWTIWHPSDAVVADSNFFVGTTANGVYQSSDIGASWRQLNAGMGDLEVGSIKLSSDGYVYAGTSRGVFKSQQSVIVAPSSPILAAPLNAATNQSTGVSLGWNPATRATSYRLQVSTSPSFSSTVYDQSNLTNTSAPMIGLLNSTTYYWRVSAANANGTSPYSSAWSFRTIPPVPLPGEYSPDANTALLLHMNETAGAVVSDASISGTDGTATGTNVVSGRFGNARNFNGSTDYVEGSSSSMNFAGQNYTLEAWIRTSSSASQAIFTTHDPTGGNFSNLGLYIAGGSSGGFFDMDINNGQGTSTSNFNGVKVNDGRWHHVAGVRNGALVTLYVDGKVDFQKTVTQEPHNSTIYRVGQSDPGSYFVGVLDEVRISSKARTPQEFDLQLPPTNVSATANGSSIDLSWQNGGGAVGLLRYRIYRGLDSTSVFLIDSTSSTSYTNSGLTAGTRYFYRISAVDLLGFEGGKSFAGSAIAQGLIAYYPFNGNARDTSGNGFHGTVDGATLTTDRFGNPNKAYYFNGSSGIEIGTGPVAFPANEYSFSVWAEYDGPIDGAQRAIIDDRSAGWQSPARIYYWGEYGNSFLYQIESGTSVRYNALWSPAQMTGVWHHYVITYKNANMKFYGDGGLIQTVSGPSSLPPGNLNIGMVAPGAGGANYWLGKIDDLRVYNRELAASDITTLFHENGWPIAAPGVPLLAQPANGAMNQPINATLSWNASSGATGYRLQVSSDSNFVTTVYDQSGVTATSQAVGGLSNNIAYYWRVSATNSGGASAYSASWKFTTIVAAPVVPILASPTNGAMNQPVNIALSWNASAGATSYRLQVSTNSSFSPTIYDQSNLTGTTQAITGLLNNTIYYWRSSASNVGGTSAYSAPWSFTTVTASQGPVAYYPFNGNANDESGNGSNGIVNGATLTTDRFGASNKAYAFDVAGSEVRIANNALLNPPTSITVSAWFRFRSPWSGHSISIVTKGYTSNNTAVNGYFLAVNQDATEGDKYDIGTIMFTTLAGHDAGISYVPYSQISGWNHLVASFSSDTLKMFLNGSLMAKTYAPGAIQNGTTDLLIGGTNNPSYVGSNPRDIDDVRIYARALRDSEIVALYHEGGWPIQQSPPPTPTLATPSNGAAGVSTAPTLGWNASVAATTYRLQVSTDQNLGTTVYDQSGIATTSQAMAGLLNNTTYYWRVSASNAGGTSAYSTPWSFTTISAVPASPSLLSPANRAANQPVNVTLSWNASGSATGYRLQVSSDSLFVSSIYDQSNLTSTSQQVAGLLNNKSYFWRVSASSSGGTSSWSNAWSFNTTAHSCSVSLPNSSTSVYTALRIPVTVGDQSGVTVLSFQFTASCDTSILQMDGADLTGTVASSWSIVSNDSLGGFNKGRMRVAAAGVVSLSGSGPLVYLRCTTKGKPGTSSLQLSDFVFNSGDPVPSLTNGSVTVAGWRRGDVDGNGIVQAADAALILRHVVGLAVLTDPAALFAADASGDGTITAYDASLTLQAAAGIIALTNIAEDAHLGKTPMVDAAGSVGFGSPEATTDPLVVKIAVKLQNAANVYSVQLVGRGDMSRICVDGVNLKLPDGWGTRWNVVGNELRVAAAGTTPLTSPDLGYVALRLKEKESRVNLSMEVMLNENVQSLGAVDIGAIPTMVALEQNYPNPFNPSTTIRYGVPNSAIVSLSIYNTLGQVVATLVNEFKEAGYYQVEWKALVPSGIYFYKLSSGGVVETKRMVLIK